MKASASAITRAAVAAAGILLASGLAAAKPVKSLVAISPVFAQLVAFSLPAEFTTASEQANAGNYIREAVPKGETVDKWTQMITITGAKGLAAKEGLTPEAFAASIAAGFKQACPETFFAKGLRRAKFDDHDAFIALASCGKVNDSADKHSETALIVAIKGAQDYYTVQWAERTPSSAENLTFDEAKWEKRLQTLNPIRVCALVKGEKPPYPSCITK